MMPIMFRNPIYAIGAACTLVLIAVSIVWHLIIWVASLF